MYKTDALAGSLRALKNCKNGVIDSNIKNSRQPKNCREYLLNGKIDPPSDSDIFLTGYAGGLWTGGGKNLCFSLPVAYNLSNIKKVIPTKITLTSRQAGSYCYGGADDHEEVDLKTDIVKIDPIKDMSQLNFSITFPTVRAKTNNDATGVSYSIFLKLQDF